MKNQKIQNKIWKTNIGKSMKNQKIEKNKKIAKNSKKLKKNQKKTRKN